jgi:uncharacterized protein YbjQ (UPF0145 family)
VFEFIVYVVVPLVVLIVGATIGAFQEKRHLASLEDREPAVAGIPVTDLRSTPPGMIAVSGELVMGQVVLGSDRGKQVVAQLRSLLGGEVRSFQKILVRARREARLRMLEEARRIGADCVINVRFETSEITNLASEVLCYGTAIRTTR